MVVLLHSSYSANGWPSTLDLSTASLSLIECFSIIAVNVFVLITGYFSTTLKRQSLFSFLFIVFFYGVIKIIFQLLSGCFKYSSLLILTNQNWFVLCYLCLILLSPIVNEWIKHTNRKQLGRTIILLFTVQTITDFFPGIGEIFNKGCSPLSFLNIYLLGRYVNLYGGGIFFYHSKLIYFSSSILLFMGCTVILYFQMPQIALFHWLYYSNPLIIISALSFFGIFAIMRERHNRIINHLASSCLAILLLHVPLNAPLWPAMEAYYKSLLSRDFNLLSKCVLWFLGILVLFAVSIAIDQIRIKLWRYMNYYKK